MANIGYVLDEFGTNPDNKVTERRILTSKVIDGRCFMIPKVTPFYGDVDKFTIKFGNNILLRDIDYQLILHSPELEERLGKEVCGGILFHKLEVNQIVDIEYQTPGGDFNMPLGHTVENLARIIRNPLYTTFSQITGTPTGLPTFSHIEDWQSVSDWADFGNKLQLVYLALLAKNTGNGGDGSAFLTALQQHITGTSAHTKEQVGLGNLFNYPVSQYSDFAGPTYPNNKYVTPRTVMYAINLFIGNAINEVNEKISELEQLTQGSKQEWTALKQQWIDLQTTLNSVSLNYQALLRQVQGYQQAVENIDQSYQVVIQNQQTWTNKLNEFNQTLINYQSEYAAVIDAKNQLLQQMETLNASYVAFNQTQQQLLENINAYTVRTKALEAHTLYPAAKTLTSGSFNFKIKKNEKFKFILVGAGGGVGEYITDPPSLSSIMNGEHGQNTTLWCLTSMTNGEQSPDNIPLAIAGGGFGGCSSYGNVAGDVSSFGIGGRGGKHEIRTDLVTLLEGSDGEGGFKGFGQHNASNLSAQETGYEFFGKWWGKGAITATAVGQGGEGAKLDFTFTNTSNYDLEFMVVVGSQGRSYDPLKSNATGGLAIITKI